MIITQCLSPVIKYDKIKLQNHFYEILASTFSHELTTPLNTIINLMESIKLYISDEKGLTLYNMIKCSNN